MNKQILGKSFKHALKSIVSMAIVASLLSFATLAFLPSLAQTTTPPFILTPGVAGSTNAPNAHFNDLTVDGDLTLEGSQTVRGIFTAGLGQTWVATNGSLNVGALASISTAGSAGFKNLTVSNITSLSGTTIVSGGFIHGGGGSVSPASLADGWKTGSNTYPVQAWSSLGSCGCVTWMSNATLYLICTNSLDSTAYTNRLGGKP